jgi:hypothetical protein
MIFQEPGNSSAVGEPSAGAEAQGQVWALQPAALAYDYMDEEIEDVMIASEPQVLLPHAPIDPAGQAGLD